VKEILEAERQTQLQPALRQSVWIADFLRSDDLDEAIRAFQEGREPTFEGC
jgi:enoyl-CoA hydratase/carnithine racemase